MTLDDEEFFREIGHRLRSRRDEQGWTQAELARRCDLHKAYIGFVERGERNVSLITNRLPHPFLPLADEHSRPGRCWSECCQALAGMSTSAISKRSRRPTHILVWLPAFSLLECLIGPGEQEAQTRE
jgi:DNA-binding XRE family transcriptional regulator